MRNENKPELDKCEFSAQIEDPPDETNDVIFGLYLYFRSRYILANLWLFSARNADLQ